MTATRRLTSKNKRHRAFGDQARGTIRPPRRTDADLIAAIKALVAEHPGEEIKVQPLAKELGIGRDRARMLLDHMNVRPIRKAN